MIYIDRISNMNQNVDLNGKTIHKLFLTSVVVAAKFHDDEFYCNSFYSRVGGLSLQEMNYMEKEFLNGIQYNLYIGTEIYELYSEKMKDYGIQIHLQKAFCSPMKEN